jgi:hypothetical protein
MIAAVVAASTFAYVSNVPKGRFINKVFSQVTKTSAVKYGSNTNPLNNNAQTDLLCDIFEPTGDTCSSRPCIVCVFGGGFVSGNRGGNGGDGDAQTYANYGYVAVAIDYRIWGAENDANHKIWPAGFVVTAQDVRACVRFMRANASKYRIDTSRVAVSGCSSGAFIALNVAFMDKPSKIPSIVDTNKYGGIEGKSGTPGVNSKVCAAAGNSGAFLDTNWIEATSPPYCGYQSTPDGWGVPTDTSTPRAWTYWLFYGITPISVRLTHMGLLAGTAVGSPGAHCPGGFPDSAHMFFYNAICQVGRKSGANINLSTGKPATQSSTYNNMIASRANDGNIDGNAANNSVAQTNSGAQPWWQVDLGAEYIIDSIQTYNRTDSLASHQINYDVKFTLDLAGWETCSYERGTMKSPSTYSIRGGILGRYVRLQLRGTNSLALSEVKVWGRDPNSVGTAYNSGNPSPLSRINSHQSAVFTVTSDAGKLCLPASMNGTAASIAVYNLSGKLMQTSTLKEGAIRLNDARSVKNGIYVVRVRANR